MKTASDAAAVIPLELQHTLRELPRMALAFSGGLDSRFLAFAGRLWGSHVHLFLAAGPHIPRADTEFACAWAAANGFPLHLISLDPLLLPDIASNSRSRCYSCKKALLARVRAAADTLPGSWSLCDGTQADDLRAFRPGQKALQEAGVVSPLANAHLTKVRIRQLAGTLGMDYPQQKARPCLLTRLAYGLRPSADLLERVAETEAQLQGILDGETDFRLRLTPEPLLQTSVDIGPVEYKAREILAENGFEDAKFLVSERISGFFD